MENNEIKREVMDCIFLQGYDYNTIADRLGYSESNIKKIASKILKKI